MPLKLHNVNECDRPFQLTWRTWMFQTGRRDVIVRCQLWLGGLLAIKPCQSAQLIWIYSYKVHITSTYRSYKAALHCGLRVQQLISARTAHEEHSSQLRESQDKVQAAFELACSRQVNGCHAGRRRAAAPESLSGPTGDGRILGRPGTVQS